MGSSPESPDERANMGRTVNRSISRRNPDQHRNRTMNRYLTVGLGVLAGAALFEAALIPGILIGGAVLLAPRYLPRLSLRLSPDPEQVDAAPRGPGPAPPRQDDAPRISLPAGLQIKQAIAKTITFRIIGTGLDFTTNYVVLGELAIAAGLSTVGLVVAPIFYFTHETLWNYLAPADSYVDLATLPATTADAPADPRAIVINRPLAKTITYLPHGDNVGVSATARGGIGDISVDGLERRDDRWVSAGYDRAPVRIHLDVAGGVGDIRLVAK